MKIEIFDSLNDELNGETGQIVENQETHFIIKLDNEKFDFDVPIRKQNVRFIKNETIKNQGV